MTGRQGRAAAAAAPAEAKQPQPSGPPQPGVDGKTVPLRGSAARVVSNMTTSLAVPTATSFRVIPAKLLEVNRLILNNQLARTGTAGKVSFTHLIGWAVVQAVRAVPAHQFELRRDPRRQDGGGTVPKPARAGARPCSGPPTSTWVLPSTSSVPTGPGRSWCR